MCLWYTLQVVTCSGVHADGSLRIVRNGIGMIEQATVELSGEFSLSAKAVPVHLNSVQGASLSCSHIAGMRGIWSLKATSMDAFDTFLVLTFVGETRILAINSEDELDEAEIEGFDSEAQVSSNRFNRRRCSQLILQGTAWPCRRHGHDYNGLLPRGPGG